MVSPSLRDLVVVVGSYARYPALTSRGRYLYLITRGRLPCISFMLLVTSTRLAKVRDERPPDGEPAAAGWCLHHIADNAGVRPRTRLIAYETEAEPAFCPSAFWVPAQKLLGSVPV